MWFLMIPRFSYLSILCLTLWPFGSWGGHGELSLEAELHASRKPNSSSLSTHLLLMATEPIFLHSKKNHDNLSIIFMHPGRFSSGGAFSRRPPHTYIVSGDSHFTRIPRCTVLVYPSQKPGSCMRAGIWLKCWSDLYYYNNATGTGSSHHGFPGLMPVGRCKCGTGIFIKYRKRLPQIPVVDSGCTDVSVKDGMVVLGSGAVEKAVSSDEQSPHTVKEALTEVVQARLTIHKRTINKSGCLSGGGTKFLNEMYSRQWKSRAVYQFEAR